MVKRCTTSFITSKTQPITEMILILIKTLSKVLQIFNKKGLTLSTKKCHLAMKSLEFLGYVFIQHCLKPSRDNVNALEEELPESKEALRSFLDMVG